MSKWILPGEGTAGTFLDVRGKICSFWGNGRIPYRCMRREHPYSVQHGMGHMVFVEQAQKQWKNAAHKQE